jgi:hypothetical protein
MVTLNMIWGKEAILAEIQGEQIQNKIKMTDDMHVSMHVGTEDDNIPVMYDDEPRNPREILKHKETKFCEPNSCTSASTWL